MKKVELEVPFCQHFCDSICMCTWKDLCSLLCRGITPSQDPVRLDTLQNQHHSQFELDLCNGTHSCTEELAQKTESAVCQGITALTEVQVDGVLSKEDSKSQGMLLE